MILKMTKVKKKLSSSNLQPFYFKVMLSCSYLTALKLYDELQSAISRVSSNTVFN
jgi:hypothetical protein